MIHSETLKQTMPPNSTGHILKQLRVLMNNKEYVAETLAAYIIPSGDAHQVSMKK